MKSVLSRIFASFDRIPAPLAFAVMAGAGGLEAFALLHGDHSSTLWYVRAAPFTGFGSMLFVAMFLIASSRPVVVHRESTNRQSPYLRALQDFGRLITFHASIAIILVIPALILSGKFAENPQTADSTPIPPPSSLPTPSASTAALGPPIPPSSTSAPVTSFEPASTRAPQPSAVPTTRSSTTVRDKPAIRAPGPKPAPAPDDTP